MINDLAKQLIHDLRFDAHTREHFSITSWEGRGTCGTVGCIAGTAILRAAANAGFVRVFSPRGAEKYVGDAENFLSPRDGTYIQTGARLLGMEKSIAGQLFIPGDDWVDPLQRYGADAEFITRLSHNERPDVSTVDKMIAWANNMPPDAWHPTHCANALENLLGNERRYVDWAEVWCEPEAVS